MRRLKFGNVILCDYAAPGHRNKHIIVNAYSGDIRISSFPASLQLGLYVELLAFSGRPPEFAMEFELERKKVAQLNVKLEDVASEDVAPVVISTFNLGVSGPTVLKVYAVADGFRRSTILSKSIDIGLANPTA